MRIIDAYWTVMHLKAGTPIPTAKDIQRFTEVEVYNKVSANARKK
jgi:hypothetical protein